MEMSEIIKNYDIQIGLMPFSENTREGYKSAINKFLSETDRCYRMSELDLKKYFSDFRTIRGYSDSYYNVICSSTKILYEKVLKQPRKMDWFSPIKTEKTFKDIITYEEFRSMIWSTRNVKHWLIMMILYSTGIRIGELLNLKICDIDFKNKRIFINSEKNGLNGYVQLHEKTERCLSLYLKRYNPKIFLFEGQKGLQYSETSVRKVIDRASQKLGKNIYPHLFRHSYVTKVIEKENVFKAQQLARHKALKSTLCYYHISPEQLQKTYNPLDN